MCSVLVMISVYGLQIMTVFSAQCVHTGQFELMARMMKV